MSRTPYYARNLTRAQGHLNKCAKETTTFGGLIIQHTINGLGGQDRHQLGFMEKFRTFRHQGDWGLLLKHDMG
jgi:hypothetical protein